MKVLIAIVPIFFLTVANAQILEYVYADHTYRPGLTSFKQIEDQLYGYLRRSACNIGADIYEFATNGAIKKVHTVDATAAYIEEVYFDTLQNRIFVSAVPGFFDGAEDLPNQTTIQQLDRNLEVTSSITFTNSQPYYDPRFNGVVLHGDTIFVHQDAMIITMLPSFEIIDTTFITINEFLGFRIFGDFFLIASGFQDSIHIYNRNTFRFVDSAKLPTAVTKIEPASDSSIYLIFDSTIQEVSTTSFNVIREIFSDGRINNIQFLDDGLIVGFDPSKNVLRLCKDTLRMDVPIYLRTDQLNNILGYTVENHFLTILSNAQFSDAASLPGYQIPVFNVFDMDNPSILERPALEIRQTTIIDSLYTISCDSFGVCAFQDRTDALVRVFNPGPDTITNFVLCTDTKGRTFCNYQDAAFLYVDTILLPQQHIDLTIGYYVNNGRLPYDDFKVYAQAPNRQLNADTINNQMGPFIISNTPDAIQKNALRIFPNPVKTHLTIEANLPIQSFKLQNLSATFFWHEKLTENTIDTAELPAGIYLIQFYTDDGQIIPRKFIKH